MLRHASNGQDVASRLLSTQLFASHAVTRTVEYLTPGPASRIRADLPGLHESHPSRSQALPRLRLVRQPGCAPQSVPAMQCLPRHKPTPPPLVTTSPSEARCRSLLSPLARAGAAAFFSSLLFRDCLGLIWPIWLIAPLFYLVHHSSRLHGPTGKQRKKRKKSFDEAASPVGTSCHTHTHTPSCRATTVLAGLRASSGHRSGALLRWSRRRRQPQEPLIRISAVCAASFSRS